jgi:hypothetical protein
MYYSYVEIEYVATSFLPPEKTLALKLLIFHAARPVYTDTVFSKPLKATINVFTAGKFSILKILLIVLLNSRHCQDRLTLPRPLHLQS